MCISDTDRLPLDFRPVPGRRVPAGVTLSLKGAHEWLTLISNVDALVPNWSRFGSMRAWTITDLERQCIVPAMLRCMSEPPTTWADRCTSSFMSMPIDLQRIVVDYCNTVEPGDEYRDCFAIDCSLENSGRVAFIASEHDSHTQIRVVFNTLAEFTTACIAWYNRESRSVDSDDMSFAEHMAYTT